MSRRGPGERAMLAWFKKHYVGGKYMKSISRQDVVDLLNKMLDLDHKCVSELIGNRVPCNKNIANHPTIQVTGYKIEDGKTIVLGENECSVGMLGVLNGFFGIEDGSIQMVVDEETKKILYFQIKENK